MTISQGSDVSDLSVYRPLMSLKYGIIPVHGCDIAVATVARMLDGVHGMGQQARVLHQGATLPMGAMPVLVTPSTVYGTICTEQLVREWPASLPRPWLVVVADVPAPPAAAARYRLRALRGRVAGIAELPYLPALRGAEDPQEALKNTDVVRAAAKLCRQLEGK